MQFSPGSCNFLPLRPKYTYIPHHPILEYPHPSFLPFCVRPSFAPI
jgi:hypothetical protein